MSPVLDVRPAQDAAATVLATVDDPAPRAFAGAAHRSQLLPTTRADVARVLRRSMADLTPVPGGFRLTH